MTEEQKKKLRELQQEEADFDAYLDYLFETEDPEELGVSTTQYPLWTKKFPQELYQRIIEMKGFAKSGYLSLKETNQVMHIIDDIVFNRLDDEAKEFLAHNSPSEHDCPKLTLHLYAVISFLRATTTWNNFYRLIQRAFPIIEK